MSLLVLSVLCISTTVTNHLHSQDDEIKAIEIGSQAPAWEKLPATNDKKYSLGDFKNKKATLVIFFDNHCPDCSDYRSRIVDLAKNKKQKEVEVILISVSDPEDFEDDSMKEMQKFVKESKFQGTYLKDLSQKSARSFGATITPECFLLDGNHRLVYHGAFDDNWNDKKVEKKFAEQAIDELLAGKKITTPKTEFLGCTIDYKD